MLGRTLAALVAVGCAAASPAPAAATSKQAAARSTYVDRLRDRAGKGSALTLDARLQTSAETALAAAGRAGGIVAIEPGTGTVRALFSVVGERGDPLLTAHIPGSTFKTFTAIAGLESGAITATTEKECSGAFSFGGEVLRCAAVHGRETTAEAITRSCNTFFYAVGAEIDHSRTLEVARRFGFGARTGIELADAAGVVPSEARYEELKRNPTSTTPLLDAIGHGDIRVTLLQLARAYAAIANGGKLLRLSLTGHASVERTVAIRPDDLALVRSALVDVVDKDEGTAHALAIPGFPFAGKTGSAEAPPQDATEADDTWFVAYAPPGAPAILVAARVERADVTRDAKWAVSRVLDAWRASR